MELNPNHEVTSVMRDQWHKIALLLMVKSGETHVVITLEDIQALTRMLPGETPAITIRELQDGIHIQLVSQAEGERLAREEGGLPS